MKEEGGEGVILGAGGWRQVTGFFIFFYFFFNLGGFVSFLGGTINQLWDLGCLALVVRFYHEVEREVEKWRGA